MNQNVFPNSDKITMKFYRTDRTHPSAGPLKAFNFIVVIPNAGYALDPDQTILIYITEQVGAPRTYRAGYTLLNSFKTAYYEQVYKPLLEQNS